MRWRPWTGFSFSLILTLLVIGGARAETCDSCSSCYEKLESFRGKPVTIRQIDPSRFPGGEVRMGDLFENPESELILGWSGPAHAYVLSGNMRFDGEMFFQAGRSNIGDSTIDNGVFFRFKGLPQESVDKVRYEIRRIFSRQIDGHPPASITCVAGACKVLKAGGIEVGGPFGDGILATRTFARMIENGFVDSRGKPIEVEIYRSHPRNLDNLHSKMKDFEKDQLERLKTPAIVVVTTGSAFGFWLYEVVQQLGRRPGAE